MSVSGRDIFDKIHQPLLGSSTNFDRVSSFFGPKGWQQSQKLQAESGGKSNDIVTTDTSEIHQALENIIDSERKIATVKDSIETAVRKIKGRALKLSQLRGDVDQRFLQVAVVVLEKAMVVSFKILQSITLVVIQTLVRMLTQE